MKAFFTKRLGSSRDVNDTERLVEGQPSSSTKSRDFMKSQAKAADKKIADDKEVVRKEIPSIRSNIDNAIKSLEGISLDEEYHNQYVTSLIERANVVEKWFEAHKDALNLSQKSYEEMREPYRKTRIDWKAYTNFPNAIRSKMYNTDHGALRQKAVTGTINFLRSAQTKLESWRPPVDSQSQSGSGRDGDWVQFK